MRDDYHFTAPPRTLHKARLDNPALLPGSALAQIDEYQELANELPDGGVLIVAPPGNAKQWTGLSVVARVLTGRGHHVRLISRSQRA